MLFFISILIFLIGFIPLFSGSVIVGLGMIFIALALFGLDYHMWENQ